MTRRPTASEITDDQLDALYAQLDHVRALADRIEAGAPWTSNRQDLARRIRAATTPPAPDCGPSVAECRDHDRRWSLEKHGE